MASSHKLDYSTVYEYRDSIANQTRFALRLARRVASTDASGSNLALSPLSIHHILSLVADGAKGPTLEHFLSVLRSGGTDELRALSSQIVGPVLADGWARGGPRLSFPNGGWLDASLSLNPSFKEIATSTYKAEVKSVDFQTKAEEARHEVNSWVEKETSGLINEILPSGSVDENTRLVLANALYFKGAWDKKFFNASETKGSEFYLLNGSSVQVPFMTTKKKQYLEAYDGFKVLELPYSQGEDERRFSMYIFLPDAQDGLWSLEERLSSESRFLNRHRPGRKAIVRRFKLPRFKISFRFEASQVLKDLGLVLPFDKYAADLTGMSDCRLCVTAIYHESVVEINEEGTEAAAATSALMGQFCASAGPPPPPVLDFEADHPFLFLIKEHGTGVVLFIGHVLNPLSTS